MLVQIVLLVIQKVGDLDTWENVTIWGIKKMTSFTDFRIRAIACDNKTKEGEPCAPLQEINEFMAGV